MVVQVRPGIYLELNRPKQRQFRSRRGPVRPVIVIHTAESGTDTSGADPKAENVANFIQGRQDYGSYHLLGDSDSIVQLVSFDNEAFHDRTGSNRWAIAISLAMNAGDWSNLTPDRSNALVDSAVQMSLIAARWLVSQGIPPPAAERLTKSQSDDPAASGFITHADRDPTRRSDPGADFPFDTFLTQYEQTLGRVVDSDSSVREMQTLVGVKPDGEIGPITLAALRMQLGLRCVVDLPKFR